MTALRLAGKHCAVVGATGIIGAHMAKAFAAHGAVVSLLGRSALQARPKLEPELVPYAPSPSPSPSSSPTSSAGASAAPPPDTPLAHRFLRLDISDPADIKSVFGGRATPTGASETGDEAAVVGTLDILVNCAGIAQTTLLKRTPDLELASIVDTNLLAPMLVCKYAKIKPNGCIINVSSLMATKGDLGVTAYAASKAGLVGLTRALCREMAARSIRVNALLPGWVKSPMWDHLKPDLKEAYLRDTPLGRVADPAEVADAAIFLASNGFANNCVLNLDGGLSAA
ncbi:3-ketoacyl-(acyl-carrier-protein) reductase [Purpureocillium lavendulum]|uniref:3-ketoacyl-(Acyl-carrier-protein) reductase n=1 Tax=Purpureocillium lavendulum TaxID=1247861 RepID=A0AB34FR36_9HYPO|nr:3-ketoacyl-(acyl-carrier-protein) reductase [Purpureocillium lavendulum]